MQDEEKIDSIVSNVQPGCTEKIKVTVTPMDRNNNTVVVMVEAETGLWGKWYDPVMIPPGYRIVGFQTRFEKYKKNQDDTALNGIRILYSNKNGDGAVHSKSVHDGYWGDWGNKVHGPVGFEVVAIKTRFEKYKPNQDDTALNGIKIRLLNRKTNSEIDLTVEEGLWGDWKAEFVGLTSTNPDLCIKNYYLAGIAVRVEAPVGSGDDTAMNGIRLYYRKLD